MEVLQLAGRLPTIQVSLQKCSHQTRSPGWLGVRDCLERSLKPNLGHRNLVSSYVVQVGFRDCMEVNKSLTPAWYLLTTNTMFQAGFQDLEPSVGH